MKQKEPPNEYSKGGVANSEVPLTGLYIDLCRPRTSFQPTYAWKEEKKKGEPVLNGDSLGPV